MSAFNRGEIVQPAVNQDAKRGLAWRQNGRDMVAAEVEQMLTRRGSQGLPDAMPKTIKAATAWILDVLLDGPAPDESIRQRATASGPAWDTPYRDRAAYLARKFLRLDEGDMFAVCEYARLGIRWRGDDQDFLRRLLDARSRPDARATGRAMLANMAGRAA